MPSIHSLPPELTLLRESMPWRVRRSGSDLQRARGDYRHPYARDRARVMHSRAFRRLQGKLCWTGLDDGEIMRTRMTQTLEIAQLSRGLLRALEGLHAQAEPWMPMLPDANLIEAIAFARHLGAPACGRGGEMALNFLMRHHGGFEAMAQSLRCIARTEPYEEGFGLDPSRRMLVGALHQPGAWHQLQRLGQSTKAGASHAFASTDWQPPRGFYTDDQDVVAWMLMPLESSDSDHVLKPLRAPTQQGHGEAGPGSLDGSIVSTAADIAMSCHEFEDGIVLGAIGRADWETLTPDEGWAQAVDLGRFGELGQALFDDAPAVRKRTIGALVNAFVVSVEIEARDTVREPLMRWQAQLMPQAAALLSQLRGLVNTRLYEAASVQAQEQRGAAMMVNLFSAYANDPQTLLPPATQAAHAAASCEADRMRVIADHMAALTDGQLTALHVRLRA